MNYIFCICGDGSSGAMESKGSGDAMTTTKRLINKMKRKEILEKKKAMDELIKAASAEKDHLSAFHAFRRYQINGLSACLESERGDKLATCLKQFIQNLLKANMEGPYGTEWPAEEKAKRREMVAPEARYIFVYEEAKRTSATCVEERGPMLGFLHFRFLIEEELPVLYVYELQLEPRVQGKGLGKFLMQLIELIARKNHMGAVVLTVLKANLVAMNFYTNKMRYVISTISPSKVDPWIGTQKSYEILCKSFSNDTKAILEIWDSDIVAVDNIFRRILYTLGSIRVETIWFHCRMQLQEEALPLFASLSSSLRLTSAYLLLEYVGRAHDIARRDRNKDQSKCTLYKQRRIVLEAHYTFTFKSSTYVAKAVLVKHDEFSFIMSDLLDSSDPISY